MKRKVLIITYYWPPSGGSGVQRVLKFSKYLPQFGIEPIILTVKNPTYSIIDETLKEEVPAGLKVYKSRSFEPFNFYATLMGRSVREATKPTINLSQSDNFISKAASWIRANIFVPDGRLGWLITARTKAIDIIKKHAIETVITSGPPHSVHFVGKYAKEKLGIKWIADFRDPWTKIFYNQLLPRTDLIKKIDLKLEKTVLKSADEVLVISSCMKKLQEEIFTRQYRLITNGFDHEDFYKNEAASTSKNAIFTIRHIGSIGESSVPYGLFQALTRLPENPEWRLELIGNVHAQVTTLIKKHNLKDKVIIKPYIPHAKAISAMKSADLLLLVIPDIEQNELILTGKLFEYIGSGRPVMLIGPRGGDADNILSRLDNPWCFEHDEIEEQKEFLKTAIVQGVRKTTVESDDLKHHSYSRFMLTQDLSKLIE